MNIINELKKRELEELDLIKLIEKHLISRRGKVITLPKPNTPVILLLSGGLDSTVVWAYLMEVFKLQVYPVFLRRGQKRVRFEEDSVDYFSSYYKKKYPKFWHEPKKMNAYIPPMEIRFPITKYSHIRVNKSSQMRGIPVYSNLLISYGVQYAYFLQITKNVRIRTVFCSFMLSDGTVMKDETLTAVRAVNLTVCSLTNDYQWQIISLPFEKNLGFFKDKDYFIKWGYENGIPLEKTRSCLKWKKDHCGDCLSCYVRKKSFRKAGVTDPTFYLTEKVSLKSKIKKRLIKLIK